MKHAVDRWRASIRARPITWLAQTAVVALVVGAVVANDANEGARVAEPDEPQVTGTEEGSRTGAVPPPDEGPVLASSVLDNFNRADEGPPPGTSWINAQGSGIEVVSNRARASGPGLRTAIWDTAYSGVVEAFYTVSVLGNEGDAAGLGVSNWPGVVPGPAGDQERHNVQLVLVRGDSTNTTFDLWGGGSHIAGPTSVALAAGDAVALVVDASTARAFRYSGGVWAEVLSASETSVIRTGLKPFVYLGNQAWRIDDFGAGESRAGGRVGSSPAGPEENQPSLEPRDGRSGR